MLPKLLIAWCLMALCVTIHAMGIVAAYARVSRWMETHVGRFWPATMVLTLTAGWMLLMHILEICVWASFYAIKGGMPDMTSAIYFSTVTYTTTGYGDLVLPPEWRLVGGVEALTGILMCGLSTSLFLAV